MHASSYKTSSEMFNAEFISKRLRNMGDQWEARISAIENIHEKFGHDIREIKERLARLISLFEDHIKTEVVHPRGPSPLPYQRVPRPFVQTMSHRPCEARRPNLRQPIPTTLPGFVVTSRPANQPSGSKGKSSGHKTNKDKTHWDLIPITYTELFPKLIEIGHIEPLQLVPFRPPFPRWYNAHTRCDYHIENPGHSTKNYTVLKRKV